MFQVSHTTRDRYGAERMEAAMGGFNQREEMLLTELNECRVQLAGWRGVASIRIIFKPRFSSVLNPVHDQ